MREEEEEGGGDRTGGEREGEEWGVGWWGALIGCVDRAC